MLSTVATLVLVAGCFGPGGGEAGPTTVQVTGSSTLAPLAAEMGKRFEARRPDVRIDVQAGGSARGIADVRRGLADVGMISRAPGPGEADLHAVAVARDGIAPIVHADNPVPRLTGQEIRALWRGEIESWSELGGPPRPVTVVNKAEGRATLDRFLDHFGLRRSEIEADVVVGANQHAIRSVAGDRGAVGYVSIGEAAVEAERGVAIRAVPLDGVEPTAENVADGRYPFLRLLHFVTVGEPTGVVRDFVEFSRSSAVHDLVRAHSFVPVSVPVSDD